MLTPTGSEQIDGRSCRVFKVAFDCQRRGARPSRAAVARVTQGQWEIR